LEIGELIEGLQDPACYPSRPARVEVRQTHASAVFLAGEDVYKLKKPVDFGFLDFSTLAKRGRMCRQEVGLNRRLAPSVYLGVERLVERGGALRVGGAGRLVDYLVHMRRLDDESSLAAAVRGGAATTAGIEAVAEMLAAFHLKSARGLQIDAYGAPAAIRRNVDENFLQMQPFIGVTITRETLAEIRERSVAFLADNAGLLQERVARGCIRDCHGDLRAEHVYFEPGGISIIDCIEFNERFRYGDVASDVAFLAMDLTRLGREDLADVFVQSYSERTPFAVGEVLDFYQCYRAFVRGKVASFRASEPELSEGAREASTAEALQHFDLSAGYARRMASNRMATG
jgi:aminoglycoside phosphotransferase family enzyme